MMRHALERSNPFWQPSESSVQPRPQGRLEGHEKDEVVVIGSGITGVTAALFLLRSGKSVAILEAGSVGDGETSRSTAHVTEVLDMRFHHLMRRFGEDRILRYSEAHRMAIHRLGSLIEELGGVGACGWSRVPGYLYCESENQYDELQQELAALDRLKIPSSLVKHVPLPFSVAHAIRVENQAQLDPDGALRLLLGTFLSEGGRLFENSRATSIAPIRKGIRISTEKSSITCDQCIIATHTPVLTPSVSHFDLEPKRTYVLAARLRSAPLIDGLFWDMASPYHHLRVAGGQLIAGGEDHRTGARNGRSTSPERRLEDYVRSRLEVESITASWSGQVFESLDGLPLVGASLRSSRIFYATGYGGNGISQGVLAGMVLSELVLGRTEDLARILGPHRAVRPRDLRSFISHNLTYPANLAASLLGRPLAEKLRGEGDLDPGTLATGEARVGTIDGRRVACHRDHEGRVRTISARCTHLGGEVAFNEFEKTWDCPCHGSRFNLDGEVLCGPATRNLPGYSVERDQEKAASEPEAEPEKKEAA